VKLSVIIPAYNEQGTVRQIIDKVKALPIEKDIIVIDDGSTDGTTGVLKALPAEKNLTVLFHERNRGKGAAIRTGIPHATGDIVVIQDADLELDPNEIPSLIAPIQANTADVVFGARFLKNPPKIRFISKVANFAVTATANILYGGHITDEAAGYKVFRSDVLRALNLKCERFEFCPEVTAKVLKKGYRLVEVPVSFINPRSKEGGKKIGWKDGVQAIWTLFKYRFID
jgi:dolichol-phosphate mannosyltransferase